MPDYLLDTNILRYWYDTNCPEHANVVARVQEVSHSTLLGQSAPHLFISVVTLGEIEFGHRYAQTPNSKQQEEYLKFVLEQCPVSLEITKHDSAKYGELKAWLMKRGSRKGARAKRLKQLVDPDTTEDLGVQENDVWIAAQAITRNLTLVTHDSRGHFGELLRKFDATLKAVDWTM